MRLTSFDINLPFQLNFWMICSLGMIMVLRSSVGGCCWLCTREMVKYLDSSSNYFRAYWWTHMCLEPGADIYVRSSAPDMYTRLWTEYLQYDGSSVKLQPRHCYKCLSKMTKYMWHVKIHQVLSAVSINVKLDVGMSLPVQSDSWSGPLSVAMSECCELSLTAKPDHLSWRL